MYCYIVAARCLAETVILSINIKNKYEGEVEKWTKKFQQNKS